MKKVLNLLLCLSLLTATSALAGKGELFNIDETAVQQELAELDQLESYVESGQDLTWTELQTNHQDFLASNELTSMTMNAPLGTAFTLEDMDWGAFAWGFCCCPIGFFVVAINSNKDTNQKLSFWIGWGVGVVLSTITSAIQGFGTATLN